MLFILVTHPSRERLVTQTVVHLSAEIPADFLNALRLNERNPQGAERALSSVCFTRVRFEGHFYFHEFSPAKYFSAWSAAVVPSAAAVVS